MLDKGIALQNIDAVIADLEDSVDEHQKERARTMVLEYVISVPNCPRPCTLENSRLLCRALNRCGTGPGQSDKLVRINGVSTGLAEEDLRTVVRSTSLTPLIVSE